MSTRLVVGLDGSPFAARALEAGLRRAARHGSTLIGVAVIDQPAIEQVEVGAYPGSIQLSHETVSRLFNEAKVRAQQSIENFRDLCTRADVLFEDVIHSGSAADALNEEGKTADMILLGIRTFFSTGPGGPPDDTLRRLFDRPVCPVLALPESGELPSHVIFAYDGSPNAARALQAYVHVTPNLPGDVTVTLLCVSQEFEKHKYDLERAEVYLRAHGYTPSTLVLSGAPSEVILSTAREYHPALVILGGPYYRGIAERLFGSVAESVIADGTIPVFVYH
ncbi:MAG: universal stress protein [Ignavibacteriae bacterium]|nr:universal stress protein [Ignavibacteriota bacterium]